MSKVEFWIEDCRVCSNLHEINLHALSISELVKLSIAKWEFIAGVVENNFNLAYVPTCGGAMTCALCHQFIEIGCQGCPIEQVTGIPGCADTPYITCQAHGFTPRTVAAEIKFLYRVLEEIEEE